MQQRIFNDSEYQSLKELIDKIKRPSNNRTRLLSGNKICWYPHCGNDFSFINSILLSNMYVSPRNYILNDESLDIEQIYFDKKTKIIEQKELLFRDRITENSHKCLHFKIKNATDIVIHLIIFNQLKSEVLLNYYIQNNIKIDYIFTSRMAGGINNPNLIEARKTLKYKYLISDLHCLKEGNYPDGEGPLIDMMDYANDLGFNVIDIGKIQNPVYPDNNYLLLK